MRLLNVHTLQLESFPDDRGPVGGYSILSHAWGQEEVSFKDLSSGQCQRLIGYRKILGCCDISKREGLDYTWIDTCCIDKTSSAELSEAINSMFKWYYMARVCYAFLDDVEIDMTPLSYDVQPDPPVDFAKSRWFTRGWTLQELIAPDTVVFLDSAWREVGTRQSLATALRDITGIPLAVLDPMEFRYPIDEFLERYSTAERMSWAASRKTTRIEDEAYCLMGLFNVNMPLLYGEGRKAFQRLQRQILESSISRDISLFAWKETKWVEYIETTNLFALSPAVFQDCGSIKLLPPPVPRPVSSPGLQPGGQDGSSYRQPLKTTQVSHTSVRLHTYTLGSMKELLANNPSIFGPSVQHAAFFLKWKEAFSDDHLVTAVLSCGTADGYTILVLRCFGGVFRRMHPKTVEGSIGTLDVLNLDDNLRSQLRPRAFDLELGQIPPMLAQDEFLKLFERRGVRLILQGHTTAGYCLSECTAFNDEAAATSSVDVETVWLEHTGHIFLQGDAKHPNRPGIHISYAYGGTWSQVKYKCYTLVEPDEDALEDARHDYDSLLSSRQVPELSIPLTPTRFWLTVKPRVSSWSCTLICSINVSSTSLALR